MNNQLDSEIEHNEALVSTGFWGKAGAGCIFMANDTKRLLIPFRGEDVLNPNCWGNWGGAIDIGESPIDAVQREVQEEAGYHEPYDLILIHKFINGTFTYHNYIAIVDTEFTPVINWETSTYGWFSLDELPTPLHFGWDSMLADPICMAKLYELTIR